MLRFFSLFFISVSLGFGGFSALADDEPGGSTVVVINRLFFEPQGDLFEPSHGTFGPVSWAAGFKSRLAPWIDVQALVGSPQLLWRPHWSPAPTDSLTLVEGTATLHSLFGDLYAGQMMVPWGLEGQSEEENLYLPRSLFYEQGLFPLRDVGVGFKTDLDGFYMNVAGHNGEGGGLNNTDNRAFVTGQFGHKGAVHSNMGFSLTTGRIASPLLAAERRVRGGNAFFGFNIFGLGLQIEASYLQTFSEAGNADILAWHGDIQHPITDNINLVGRYEQENPDTQVTTNILGRGYLGAELHSKDNVSRFFVYFIKNNESLQEMPNDEVRIVWRVAPTLD